MASFTRILVITWILIGFVGLIWGTKALRNPANKKWIEEHIKELANEMKVTEEDFICMLYVAFYATGFIGVILAAYRKFRAYIKEKLGV